MPQHFTISFVVSSLWWWISVTQPPTYLVYAAASAANTAATTLSTDITSTSSNNNICQDNEASYNWPASQDAWVLAHNAIRQEIADMYQVLQQLSAPTTTTTTTTAAADNDVDTDNNKKQENNQNAAIVATERDDDWQWRSFRAWWRGHAAHVRTHCQNESLHLFPAIAARVPIKNDDSVLDLQHQDIDGSIDAMDRVVQALIKSSSSSSSSSPPRSDNWNELWKAWKVYQAVVVRHLDEEEETIVPIVRQAFASQEWAPMIRTFFDRGAPEEFGSFLYHNYNHGDRDTFRNAFMKPRGIPGFVWSLSFRKKLLYYETSMVKHIQALQTGVPHNEKIK
mmetsp:Transcript_2073/g.4031  ORF Transcript_2073/g.4031 Transcript_2073/m.4031 type:complete len:338 (-) Transcript_2073:39-1052(-)